jgi:hypothetical protein
MPGSKGEWCNTMYLLQAKNLQEVLAPLLQ